MESCQQERAQGILKRILVASMACVVVWQLGKAQGEEGRQARQLLIRLSGRQMKWKVEYTYPALLSGLWSLLSMLEVLQEYEIEHLREMAHRILPGFTRFQEAGKDV